MAFEKLVPDRGIEEDRRVGAAKDYVHEYLHRMRHSEIQKEK
jgi:hypothetical protein